MSRHIFATALGIAVLFGVAAFTPKPNWPAVSIPKDMDAGRAKGVKALAAMPVGPTMQYYQHEADGLYLHRGPFVPCKPGQDEMRGVPHPSRVAHCGLRAYGVMLQTKGTADEVRHYADRLISLQDETGAFRIGFAWEHYLNGTSRAGWASALTQGRGMSLLARAYHATGDEKYLQAGEKALDFMLTPVDQGGVMTTMAAIDPSLKDFIFLEEYATTPASYTLNGYIFALIGLYDWSKVEAGDNGQGRAGGYFKRGIATLTNILPYYDLGGVTSYDLGYLTFNKPSKVSAAYHILHVQQLHTLYKITREPKLKEFEDKWTAYLTR